MLFKTGTLCDILIRAYSNHGDLLTVYYGNVFNMVCHLYRVHPDVNISVGEILTSLLKDYSCKDICKNYKNALMLAVCNVNPERIYVIEFLLSHICREDPGFLNWMNQKRHTALSYACAFANVELNGEPSRSAIVRNNKVVLEKARANARANETNLRVVKMLLDAGANINIRVGVDNQPLTDLIERQELADLIQEKALGLDYSKVAPEFLQEKRRLKAKIRELEKICEELAEQSAENSREANKRKLEAEDAQNVVSANIQNVCNCKWNYCCYCQQNCDSDSDREVLSLDELPEAKRQKQ